MLKRKIEKYLGQWKEAADRKPLVIKGIRQCGKTYIVQKFATENYESVVYINFILEPDKKSAFHGNIDVDTIILNLSALIPGSRFINGKTCIILDEIQECKEARTSLKSFCIDGRFDIIATGSLLGVKGYGKTPKKDIDGGQDSVPRRPPVHWPHLPQPQRVVQQAQPAPLRDGAPRRSEWPPGRPGLLG